MNTTDTNTTKVPTDTTAEIKAPNTGVATEPTQVEPILIYPPLRPNSYEAGW